MRFWRNLFRRVRSPFDRAVGAFVLQASAFLARMPAVSSMRAFDGMAEILYRVDRRGRRAARENLRVVFGDTLAEAERRRILHGSYRTLLRSIWALLYFRTITEEEYARWVSVSPEDEAFLRRAAAEVKSGVMVSGHFGNWELLLASRSALPYSPRFYYLAEQTPFPSVDVAIDRLRDRGGGSGALRKGGSMALKAALARGECVSVLADRNVRFEHGGVYVPFLGLPARTTPLAAFLARRFDVPVSLVLCRPEGRRRWRLFVTQDLRDPPSDDEEADIRRVLVKVNETLGQAIREQPEAWLWMIKRWKSRPTEERGAYPDYSYYDPDR